MSTFPCILYFFDKYTSSSVSQKIVLLSIVIGCLFFCIAFFLKTKIIPIAIAFIIIIPSLILISSFLISGGLFKRSDYDVIFATNLGEANEFVVSFFNYKFLLLILYILFLF
jgi:glucan phosphoethanolaminetransferase (alkaline phosphatase superfamily)